MILVNLVTPKAAAKVELLFNKTDPRDIGLKPIQQSVTKLKASNAMNVVTFKAALNFKLLFLKNNFKNTFLILKLDLSCTTKCYPITIICRQI
jgi:hypothetical protein